MRLLLGFTLYFSCSCWVSIGRYCVFSQASNCPLSLTFLSAQLPHHITLLLLVSPFFFLVLIWSYFQWALALWCLGERLLWQVIGFFISDLLVYFHPKTRAQTPFYGFWKPCAHTLSLILHELCQSAMGPSSSSQVSWFRHLWTHVERKPEARDGYSLTALGS